MVGCASLLPRPDSPPVLKRFIATVLFLGFGLFSLESLIADVHDGDASAAEVASAPSASGVTDLSVAAIDSGGGSEKGPDGVPQPRSGHGAHVCHCVHLHGYFVTAVPALAPLPTSDQASMRFELRTPDQVALDVHLRPPIA